MLAPALCWDGVKLEFFCNSVFHLNPSLEANAAILFTRRSPRTSDKVSKICRTRIFIASPYSFFILRPPRNCNRICFPLYPESDLIISSLKLYDKELCGCSRKRMIVTAYPVHHQLTSRVGLSCLKECGSGAVLSNLPNISILPCIAVVLT